LRYIHSDMEGAIFRIQRAPSNSFVVIGDTKFQTLVLIYWRYGFFSQNPRYLQNRCTTHHQYE